MFSQRIKLVGCASEGCLKALTFKRGNKTTAVEILDAAGYLFRIERN